MPKSDQKVVKQMTPKITKKMKMLGPKMGQDGDHGAQAQPSGRCLGSPWFQDALKMPQDGVK
jgi:hypothetical protein